MGWLASRARCPACGSILDVPAPQAADTSSIASPELRTNGPSSPPSTAPFSSGVLLPGQQFSKYRIQRQLGAGAMGEVWLARDAALDRDVALKILPPSLGLDEERLRRFFREARLAAKLNHPNTVTVYDTNVEGGLPFLAMEYIDGGSLEEKVRNEGPLPWREATQVIRAAAAGLADAHAIGLVHRDIKPANLLRTAKGTTKVADFGLARAAGVDSGLTVGGAQLGTPAYMAPEQWNAKEADSRSDLYALVCSYYFLLTGHVPFEGASIPALGYLHAHEPFPDARQFASDLPERLCDVLKRGSQKNPDQRYQSAEELISDLDALLSGPPGAATHDSPTAPSIVISDAALSRASWKRRSPRNRVALLGAVAASVVVLGVVLYVGTDYGTVKIELSDPAAQVDVELDKTIEIRNVGEPVRLRLASTEFW